jgi:hypothetical protein
VTESAQHFPALGLRAGDQWPRQTTSAPDLRRTVVNVSGRNQWAERRSRLPHGLQQQCRANGDTLICQGADGIFFEVTPEKEIVWKYVSPVRKGGPGTLKTGGGAPTAGAVFRAYRYAPDYPGLAGRNVTATLTVEQFLAKEGSKE